MYGQNPECCLSSMVHNNFWPCPGVDLWAERAYRTAYTIDPRCMLRPRKYPSTTHERSWKFIGGRTGDPAPHLLQVKVIPTKVHLLCQLQRTFSLMSAKHAATRMPAPSDTPRLNGNSSTRTAATATRAPMGNACCTEARNTVIGSPENRG